MRGGREEGWEGWEEGAPAHVESEAYKMRPPEALVAVAGEERGEQPWRKREALDIRRGRDCSVEAYAAVTTPE